MFRSCTPGNSSLQEKNELSNSQPKSLIPLGQQASISSLDPRRSSTTSTHKPLVRRSRSSDSPKVED
jgi:hypothetical protein